MTVRILTGDCRETLAMLDAESVQTCVTSPPYFGLRDYGHAGQIGLESTPDAYVAELVAVFREVRRVLRADGTLWLNLGDSYAGSWGNQGRKDGPGTQRAKTRPSIQTFGTAATHAIECDMGEDCTCGVEETAKYPDKQTRTGSWVNDHPTLKPKDLIGIPWRVAFALQADGWYLRSDIIWSKPNPMPESVADRPTKAHEYVFLLSKSERYCYDASAIAEPSGGWNGSAFDDGKNAAVHPNVQKRPSAPKGSFKGKTEAMAATGQNAFRAVTDTRNARSVWSIATQPFAGSHFATMPPALAERCIRAGSRPGDTVLDPFGGAGTTGLVADRLGRDAILCELNPAYAALAADRVRGDSPLFAEVSA